MTMQNEVADRAEQIAAWEDQTGLVFSPNGPELEPCEHCDALVQFVPDHSCAGSRIEARAAAAFEDAAYGRPDR